MNALWQWLARKWTEMRYRWLLWIFMQRLRRAKYKLGRALLPALLKVGKLANELEKTP